MGNQSQIIIIRWSIWTAGFTALPLPIWPIPRLSVPKSYHWEFLRSFLLEL